MDVRNGRVTLILLVGLLLVGSTEACKAPDIHMEPNWTTNTVQYNDWGISVTIRDLPSLLTPELHEYLHGSK